MRGDGEGGMHKKVGECCATVLEPGMEVINAQESIIVQVCGKFGQSLLGAFDDETELQTSTCLDTKECCDKSPNYWLPS